MPEWGLTHILAWSMAALCAAGWCAASVTGYRLRRLRNNLRARLARRDRSLARSLALVDMAEELAALGRWRATPQGVPEWSNGMCRITGFPPGMTPDFETQCEMMPDGGATFYGALERHKRDRAPFAFEFAATRFDGEERTLRVIVRNEFDEATGKLLEWQGIALDVTDSQRRLQALASERSEALARAAEARHLAETDPLTGLANRRRAMAEADRAALAAARDGAPMALVLFDIDHFKQVNDCFGHLVGDAVLARVAEIAGASLRPGEMVGRIGGEEFLCVLPGANLVIARTCAERLRKAIATGSGSEDLPAVTVSIGYAAWRLGDSALSLFARADAALYDAKAAGRDCVRRAA
jgi:diguanylate cyclase (GGDEF)-like protein